MADEKEEVQKVDAAELTEEQQQQALIKAKTEKTPVLGEKAEEKKSPEAKKKDGEDDDADEPEDKSEGKKKDEKQDEPTEPSAKEIKEKLAELGKKEDKDLTKEEKEFIKEHSESDEDEYVDPDKFVAEQFEDFEVKSVKDLHEMLETAVETTKERDELKVKLEAAEKKEPKYKSDAQKKVAEFLEKTGYDPDKFPEGLQTHAELMAMDLDDKSVSPKRVLEAKFVLDHPELTRDEARRKFEKSYNKKYVLNKDDFDKAEDFAEAEEDARVDQKTEVAKAIKALKKTQEEFKAEPANDKDKKDKAEAPVIDPVIAKSIEQNSAALTKYLEENDQLIFSPTDDEEDEFPYQLEDDQIKGIQAVCHSILSNPSSYDKKGKLLLGHDVEDLSRRAAHFLFFDDIQAKLYEHARTITATKRIEDLSEVKPTRKPKQTTGASNLDMSEEQQQEIMIKKKKEGKAITA